MAFVRESETASAVTYIALHTFDDDKLLAWPIRNLFRCLLPAARRAVCAQAR